MRLLIVLFTIISFTLSANNNPSPTAAGIVGTWLSKNKDLKVEIYQKGELFYGKIVWFSCSPSSPPMESFRDKENPNPKLQNRPWLGMNVLRDLRFDDKQNYWVDGKIYDPNSGHTYSSVVRQTGKDAVSVKGYFGFEIIGKSLEFTRVK